MRVIFIGTGDIGLPVLRWLEKSDEHKLIGVVTQPDKPVGREQRITPPPIKTALTSSAIPVLQPRRIKAPEAVEEIRALAPEVIVVIAYGQILPRAVLEIPSVACLNLHASLLPRHRGAAPIQAAILAGDRDTGITVMYMDEGLDTGDMLLQTRIAIAPDATGGSLHHRLAELAPDALREALRQLADRTAPRIPQDPALATYAPKLEREHGRIDWNEPAELIERKIRAFDPWPGTYTIVRERKLKIFTASITSKALPPAEVAVIGEELLIGARDGSLRIGELQVEAKKRMRAADFIRGNPWIVGARCD